MKKTLIALAVLLCAQFVLAVAPPAEPPVVNPYSVWEGFVPADDPWFFPLAVYTQEPKRAGKYKAIGINVFFHLWQGPTAEQIAELEKHGMRTVCEFNEYAEKNLLDSPVVLAWTHLDEPDLVSKFKRKYLFEDQERAKALVKEHWPKMYDEMDLDHKDYGGWGFGYGPEYCRKHYEHIKQFDTKRPVIMGLSKGVVVPFKGRGDRADHNEDYIEYLKGTCDMNGFDIYPVAYGRPDELNLVPKGIENLNKWDANNQLKWCAIECTFGRPDNPSASPEQIRAETWMAIIHGARAIGYFVHHFDKNGKYVTDNGLLEDPEMTEYIKHQNAEIKSLAKVIYAPEIDAVSLTTQPEAELDYVAKKVDDAVYILSSTLTTNGTEATFTIEGLSDATVEVINENRTVPMKNGTFFDAFGGYDVNLYRINL